LKLLIKPHKEYNFELEGEIGRNLENDVSWDRTQPFPSTSINE
jgi:hypothetical protein